MFSRLANLVRARVSATLGGIRWLRGFVTVPGSISLMGIALAIVTRWLDWLWVRTFPDFGLNLSAQHGELSTLLTTIAGSTMTALSLVYSSVLVVFTLAAPVSAMVGAILAMVTTWVAVSLPPSPSSTVTAIVYGVLLTGPSSSS